VKILFLNPPGQFTLTESPNENGDGLLESDDFGYFPPLGLLYVLSYLQEKHPEHEIIFKDCIAERLGHRRTAEYIATVMPDVVGITSFTIALVDIVKVAEAIRKINPDCHICLGGHHPIAFPVQAAKLPQFDSVVVGEGEYAFSDLISCLDKGEDFTHITGVYTKTSIETHVGDISRDKRFLNHVNVPVAYVDDLADIPIPDRRYLEGIEYNSIVGSSAKMATILSTRGCPYLCTFCDVPYKKYRTRTIESVVDEVEVCLAQGYEEFHFYDDLFNITSKKVIEFCDEVERRSLKFSWDFRGRVNQCSKESLIRAKRAGCRQISFGVETGSDAGLKALRKGTNTAKIERVFGWCRELGIRTIADFIIGFPFEKTKKDIMDHIDFLCKIDPDYAQIAVLMILPNTPLYFEAIEKGLVKKESWEEFCENPTTDFEVSHWEEHMSIKELTAIQAKAYRKFYFRPRYILRQIWQTRTWFEFKVKVIGALTLINSNLKLLWNFLRKNNSAKPLNPSARLES
jgi:anaerobic magnesium-protoporphyrin IX monomethyl ester cyclase